MSGSRAIGKIIGAIATVAAGAALCPGALAQGCASCRTAAENSGNPNAINTAILVLLFPTLAIFGAIVYRACRHHVEGVE